MYTQLCIHVDVNFLPFNYQFVGGYIDSFDGSYADGNLHIHDQISDVTTESEATSSLIYA